MKSNINIKLDLFKLICRYETLDAEDVRCIVEQKRPPTASQKPTSPGGTSVPAAPGRQISNEERFHSLQSFKQLFLGRRPLPPLPPLPLPATETSPTAP